jgi:hypothetical protein
MAIVVALGTSWRSKSRRFAPTSRRKSSNTPSARHHARPTQLSALEGGGREMTEAIAAALARSPSSMRSRIHNSSVSSSEIRSRGRRGVYSCVHCSVCR